MCTACERFSRIGLHSQVSLHAAAFENTRTQAHLGHLQTPSVNFKPAILMMLQVAAIEKSHV